MNIINVYNALAGCSIKTDLSSDIHVACVQMGWPPQIQELVVSRGVTIQAWQVAVALCISTSPREKLLSMESLRRFDEIISEAQTNWQTLNKSNKVSRILTDYLKT